jgi:hypothetical protein
MTLRQRIQGDGRCLFLLLGIVIGSLFSSMWIVEEELLEKTCVQNATVSWHQLAANHRVMSALRATHAVRCRTEAIEEPSDFIWVHESFVADHGATAYFVGQTGRECWRDSGLWPWSRAKDSYTEFFGKRFVAEFVEIEPRELSPHTPASVFSICRNLPHNESQIGQQVLLVACPVPAELQQLFRLSPLVHMRAHLHFVGDTRRKGDTQLPASFLDQSGKPWGTRKAGPFPMCQMSTDAHFTTATSTSKLAERVAASHLPLSATQGRVEIGACAHVAPVTDHRLVEWLEFHIMMGVEHFWLFDNSVTPAQSTAKLLLPYVLRGIVTLLHWPFPIQKGCDQSQAGAQFSVGNVCLRRYAQDAEWIAFLDVDEFMLPRRENETLTNLTRRFTRPDWLTVRDGESNFTCSITRGGRDPCSLADAAAGGRGVSAISFVMVPFGACVTTNTPGRIFNASLAHLHLQNDSCSDDPLRDNLSQDHGPKALVRSYFSFSEWVHYFDLTLNGTVQVIPDWKHDAILLHFRRGSGGHQWSDELQRLNARVAAIVPEVAHRMARYEAANNYSVAESRLLEDRIAEQQLQATGRNYLISYRGDGEELVKEG